jgi:ribonucleoside-diphosphate reductase alpha chain
MELSIAFCNFHAISASCDLAAERGRYPSFHGSLWSKGILPIDSIALLEEAHGGLENFVETRVIDYQSGGALTWDLSEKTSPNPFRRACN